ncbi:MAG: hypothetical protein RR034_00880 [Bacteroidales bacterium]
MNKFHIALISLFLLTGCKDFIHETIPNVNLDFTIYPNDVNYLELNHYGGHLYFTGGVRGVIVYRLDQNTFLAYDRACPYDWEEKDSWLWVDESGLLIVDRHCGSLFNILDGSVVQGPATIPLKRYKTRYDGVSLRVFN